MFPLTLLCIHILYFFTYSSIYPLQVENGLVVVDLPVDHVMTLSTKTGQTKGTYTPPPSKPFPIPHEDNFECKY